jgi:methyl-accepting chemotaxis protein
MRIGKKLILNTVLIVLFSVISTSVILGWATYRLTKSIVEDQIKNQLTVVRDIKKDEIETYFSLLRDQVASIANDRIVAEAAEQLKKAFFAYPTEIQLVGSEISVKKEKINEYYTSLANAYQKKTGYAKTAENLQNIFEQETPYSGLKYSYVMDNPNPLGQKFLMDSASFPVSYNQAHRKYHIRFLDFLETFKIEDVYFIDPESGFIFYSVEKNIDFGINLKEAKEALPGLYKAFIGANNQQNKKAVIGDFTGYTPALGNERAFISAPIFDEDQKVAILVFQLSIDRINDIMTNKTHWKKEGLGDTGETYLVGEDFRLRSMSRFFFEDPDKYLEKMKMLNLSPALIQEMHLKNSSIGIQPVLTEGSKQAHNGKTGFLIFNDYRNIPVLSAFAPLNIPNLDWIILSEVDVSEAFLPVKQLFDRLIASTISIAVALSLIGVWFGGKLSQRISQPIQRFSKLITTIGNDLDLTKRISVKTNDELSDMAKALNHLFDRFQIACIQTVKSTRKMEETVSLLKKVAASREGVHPEDKKVRLSTKEESIKKSSVKSAESSVKVPAAVASTDSSSAKIAKASENLEALSKKLSKVSNQFKIIQKEARRTRDW